MGSASPPSEAMSYVTPIEKQVEESGEAREISNFHFPNSCYRPGLQAVGASAALAAGEPWVDWPQLKRMTWEFVERPYDEETSLDFICPAWYNATACECDCGDCSVLFKQCPLGFMLFRALGLVCAARGQRALRLYELTAKRWGRGLISLARLRLGFSDVLLSGWPYFGVLSKIGAQLHLDGVREPLMVRLTTSSEAESLCGSYGLAEDLQYQQQAQSALEDGSAIPLESSMAASANTFEGAAVCPLQQALAVAATADWMLQPTRSQIDIDINGNPYEVPDELDISSDVGWLSKAGFQEIVKLVVKIEDHVAAWANMDRPTYFFDVMASPWPVWPFLHRVGARLLMALAMDCSPIHGALPAVVPPSHLALSGPVHPEWPLGVPRLCPACQCATQGEWASEARYIGDYVEGLHKELFQRAACSLRGGATGRAAALKAHRLVSRPLLTWRQRWASLEPTVDALEAAAVPRSPSYPRAPPQRREAFVAVLFAQGAGLEQVLLHAEALRTLAFSARRHCRHERPFLVVTDGPLPEEASRPLLADGIRLLEVSDKGAHFTRGSGGLAYGAGAVDAEALATEDVAGLQLEGWWVERGIAPTAIKLAVWNLTSFDRVVFLDADTLILGPVDELFDIDTFASGINPYSTHGMLHTANGGASHSYLRKPGINTGVMILQPSEEVAAEMAMQMEAGIHDASPVAEHLGRSDQPWLDAFWLHYSSRLGVARFGPAPEGGLRYLGCDESFATRWTESHGHRPATDCDVQGRRWRRPPWRKRQPRRKASDPKRFRPKLVRPQGPQEGHCLLPLAYDFFSDYKAIRMHVWSESRERRRPPEGPEDPGPGKKVTRGSPVERNMSDIAWAARQYVDDYDVFGERGLKILHWPGELRKPWQRWHTAVRSPFDEAWWAAHAEMCRQSSEPCFFQC